jgi:hypothetical protein
MKTFIAICISACFILSCATTGAKTLSGTIKVTGNEPHTELIIETAGGKRYQITGAKADYLRKEKQNNEVRLKGKITQEPKGPMNGTFEAVEVE